MINSMIQSHLWMLFYFHLWQQRQRQRQSQQQSVSQLFPVVDDRLLLGLVLYEYDDEGRSGQGRIQEWIEGGALFPFLLGGALRKWS